MEPRACWRRTAWAFCWPWLCSPLQARGGPLVQLHRLGLPVALTYAVSPIARPLGRDDVRLHPVVLRRIPVHAGPRWLGVRAPSAGQLSASLLAQAGGWLLWLLGTHLHVLTAFAGLALAAGGADGDDIALLARWCAPATRPTVCTRRLSAAALACGCLCLAGIGLPSCWTASSRSRPGAERHLGLRGGCVSLLSHTA